MERILDKNIHGLTIVKSVLHIKKYFPPVCFGAEKSNLRVKSVGWLIHTTGNSDEFVIAEQINTEAVKQDSLRGSPVIWELP